MSRIGKKPIVIPKEVQVTYKDGLIAVKGKKGELKRQIHSALSVEVKDSQVLVLRSTEEKKDKSLHGLFRMLVSNMVQGVSDGFEKKLELVGVGFKAEVKGKYIILTLGYSHPIYFRGPDEVKIDVPLPTSIVISGIDKELVGSVAAKLRSFREPEPYKGKGIRYAGEEIILKEGKTATK